MTALPITDNGATPGAVPLLDDLRRFWRRAVVNPKADRQARAARLMARARACPGHPVADAIAAGAFDDLDALCDLLDGEAGRGAGVGG
jgi:hypothetical protein